MNDHQDRNSSSGGRIVELLPDSRDQSSAWIIRPEFFTEDVAMDQDRARLGANGNYEEEDDDDDDNNDEDEDEDEENGEDDGDDNAEDGQYEEYPIDIVLDDYEDLGFLMRAAAQSSSDSSSEEDEGGDGVNYDITLPVSHSYLGDDLEEARGRQVLEEGSSIELNLFNLDLVLFPGQTLPFTTSSSPNLSPRIYSYLESCLSRGSRLIGIIYKPGESIVGTTAEIRSYHLSNYELKVILEGGQRFKYSGQPFDIGARERVEVLPEIVLGSPYPRLSQSQHIQKNCPAISKFPVWVYRHFDAQFLMLRILGQIEDWCSVKELVGKHPNEFSYWMSSMLPISNRERVKALGLRSAESRLMWLVELFEKCVYLCCNQCSRIVSHKDDVFAMSRSGPQCSFVNANGYIHDTLTVRTTGGLSHEPQWEKAYSWFPGYKWRIVRCGWCSNHVGWEYRRINSSTLPKSFYGLSRASVQLKDKPENEPQNEER